jgi:hypothetical protein
MSPIADGSSRSRSAISPATRVVRGVAATSIGSKAALTAPNVSVGSKGDFGLQLNYVRSIANSGHGRSTKGSAREQTAKERLVVPLWRQKFSRLAQPFADSIDVKRHARASKVVRYFCRLVASRCFGVVNVSGDGHSDYQLEQAIPFPRSDPLFGFQSGL